MTLAFMSGSKSQQHHEKLWRLKLYSCVPHSCYLQGSIKVLLASSSFSPLFALGPIHLFSQHSFRLRSIHQFLSNYISFNYFFIQLYRFNYCFIQLYRFNSFSSNYIDSTTFSSNYIDSTFFSSNHIDGTIFCNIYIYIR
jgi:hypothetical protein